MITNSRQGVFALEDAYKKIASGCWVYDGNNDPGAQTLWAWGRNDNGQLGVGNKINTSSPVQVPGTAWGKVVSGSAFGHGLKSDGTLWFWGANNSGVRGDSTNDNNVSSPVQIPGTAWSNISVPESDNFRILALKTDNTLWTWGDNTHGELGLNDVNIRRSSPVQIPGASWCAIAAGRNQALALKTNGTLWSWGRNYFGSIGNDTRGFYKSSSPVQISGTSWTEVSSNYNSSFARKTDGTLWGWGWNTAGQIGDNTVDLGKSTPVQIPGTAWNGVETGSAITMATKTDGTLWQWGCTYRGSLGDNTNIRRSSPTQIPGTSWCSKLALNMTAFAIKTDGTLWGWGYNGYGQVGDSTLINRSSPVQIPGTSWRGIASGHQTNFGRKSVP